MKTGNWIRVAILLAAFALAPGARADGEPFIPSFRDPNRTPAKPDTSAIHLIRFLTEDDFPPFNFAQADGALTGFNVDLARAICEELQVACTIQARRWDTLIPSLDDNRGDALIASLAINPQTRAQLDFTAPYMKTPGRFVAPAAKPPAESATPEKMAGRKIGVVAGSAHEAWLREFFPQTIPRPFDSAPAQRAALAAGEVDAIFGDAISLSVWLSADRAANCCGFFGGPFLDSRYFGGGIAIAVRKNNATLRRALDYALARVMQRGVYAELYLKYFPVGAF